MRENSGLIARYSNERGLGRGSIRLDCIWKPAKLTLKGFKPFDAVPYFLFAYGPGFWNNGADRRENEAGGMQCEC